MLQKIPTSNFDNFIKKIRRIAFETPFKAAKKYKLVKKTPEEDIEKIITFNEVKLLILDEYVIDHNNEFITLDGSYENCSLMLEAVIDRLINNELNKMVSEGELECYFDDESNDFRFKLKD